jgi:hypothetical protein
MSRAAAALSIPPPPAPPARPRPTDRAVRQALGWSLSKTAAVANVSPALARIFEISPAEVKDREKRRALRRVYQALRVCLGVP